jgi:DNA polymerase I-like protein with 3'-5' exonuclease and polymerase domains
MFSAATEWVCPENFPALKSYDYIAIDLETRDPNLKSKGSGSLVNEGEIIGVAVAVDGWSGYYPIAHREGNLPKQKVLDWLQEICSLPSTKIFHNAMYDMCWLKAYDIKVNGHIIDTMVMAALVDENRYSYSLNSLCYDYLGEVKDESILTTAAEKAGADPKAETRLFPCLIEMKVKGVRVDVERAHLLKSKLSEEEKQLLLQVKKETGEDVQIWAARSIGKVFDKLSLPYNRTAKTQAPSFTKNFLQVHKHPLVQCIAKAREINKAHTTFIDTIIKYQYKGRIHADINPVRGEKGGTVTGRFSYSNPNLQQVPARNKDLGPMIRSLFLPERNHTWGCFDYSQQEPRLVVHYAAASPKLREDSEVKSIVERFKNNDVDFHQTVADMAGIERSQAKTINLGLFYGMGKAKLQAELGLNTKEEAEKLFEKYHSRVPFVKDLMNNTSKDSQRNGYITTLLGRRCRFDTWEEAAFRPGRLTSAMTWEEASTKFGEDNIRRAFTYKALNKLIQGSAADMTKKAMLDLYEEKIIPHIQIHDELDVSVESEKHANKIIDIMQNAVKLNVPNKVDYESGENWGDIYD